MSSAPINASSRLAGTECCRPSKGKRSGISVIAGPHGWAATCTSATGVDIASSYITPAATGTAPSARPELALDGWRNAKPSFCLFPISTSYSLCRSRSAAWHCKTPSRFTPSYSALPPPRCWKPLPIPGCLAPPSASLRCCTPGGRTCTCIHICTASCRAEALPDGSRWVTCRKESFFLPVRLLSSRFRKKFLRALQRAFRQGSLHFHGELAPLSEPSTFAALCEKAEALDWVVHVKPPFGGPRRVLKYLARYTHRVAISNHRLRSLEEGHVRFDWKDYAHRGRKGTLSLDAVEFIRRFLLHVLPAGLVRIRQFGFLANRVRKQKLEQCRALISAMQPSVTSDPVIADAKRNDPQQHSCPLCKLGSLILVELLGPAPAFPDSS